MMKDMDADLEGGIVLNALHGQNGSRDSAITGRASEATTTGYEASVSLNVMIGEDYMQRNPLLDHIERKYPRGLRLMKFTGCYWPIEASLSEPKENLATKQVHRFIFICIRIAFIPIFIFSVWNLESGIQWQHSRTIILSITLILDVVSILPAQFINQRRLQQPAPVLDLSVIEQSSRTAEYFLWIYVCLVIVSSVVNLVATIKSSPAYALGYLAILLGELAISCYLAFNMQMLLVDLNVSSILMDQLLSSAVRQQLKLNEFTAARDDIHRRVRESKFATDIILAPCLATALSMTFLIYQINGHHAIYYNVLWFVSFCKEVIFIAVAFFFVARVNGKADELTQLVSAKHWKDTNQIRSSSSSSSNIDNSGGGGGDGAVLTKEKRAPTEQGQRECTSPPSTITSSSSSPAAGGKGDELDVNQERISIACACLAKPISVTLLWRRITWDDVALSAFAFGVSIVIGLIQSAVGLSKY
mmetsp:Transcript_5657/g.9300  ORF Transcript_5657/g.9300 Transcript_5657/m.9300 type:complete len:474 (-) Transcript_5657:321-1742(-)